MLHGAGLADSYVLAKETPKGGQQLSILTHNVPSLGRRDNVVMCTQDRTGIMPVQAAVVKPL